MRQLTADDLLTVDVKGANFIFVESNYIFIEHDDFLFLFMGLALAGQNIQFCLTAFESLVSNKSRLMDAALFVVTN
jgi:hypothetical protein